MAISRKFYRRLAAPFSSLLSSFSVPYTNQLSISGSQQHQTIQPCNARMLCQQYSSFSLPWSEVQPYNAIRVELDKNESETKEWSLVEFGKTLKGHINQWTKEGRSAIWLHVPVEHSALISEAVQHGFLLHHTLHNEIVLSRWLDKSRPSKIPHFASHQVGVCGIVLREETKELLVTQDKYKPAKWKFPGGLSELSENIADTAEREVLEETGIVAEFQSVIAFRQHHHLPMAFDQSDLYFICRMKPLTFDIIPCEDEVLKCQWVGLRELQLSPLATQLTNRIAELVLQEMETGFKDIDIVPEQWPSLLPGHTYELFVRKLLAREKEEW